MPEKAAGLEDDSDRQNDAGNIFCLKRKISKIEIMIIDERKNQQNSSVSMTGAKKRLLLWGEFIAEEYQKRIPAEHHRRQRNPGNKNEEFKVVHRRVYFLQKYGRITLRHN